MARKSEMADGTCFKATNAQDTELFAHDLLAWWVEGKMAFGRAGAGYGEAMKRAQALYREQFGRDYNGRHVAGGAERVSK